MEDDCEAFIDSEEDEVFFGCINERELQYFQKENFDAIDAKKVNNVEAEKNHECKVANSKHIKKEISMPEDDIPEESNFRNSCNTSVEMEHNYSIHLKEKIDKSILETPRSIVKADKDGGFLKVLSEIALVKAEVENNESKDECEDDNKENKINCIPEIRITEATPDKNKEESPCHSLKPHLRRFRIIYNSPTLNNIENTSKKCDSAGEKNDICNEKAQNLVKNTDNACNEKDLLPASNNSNSALIGSLGFKKNKSIEQYDGKILKMNFDSMEEKKKENSLVNIIEDSNNFFFKTKKIYGNVDKGLQIRINEEDESDSVSLNFVNASATLHDFEKEKLRNKIQTVCIPNSNLNLNILKTDFESTENASAKASDEISNLKKFRENVTPSSKPIRFSQEVRKIVEVLGKSAEDTLNSTIPEIEVNNTEDTFFSFEPISFLDENNDIHEADVICRSKLISPPTKNTNNIIKKPFNTVEKMNFKKASALPRSKIEPIRYFSEKKLQTVSQNKINKCVKKLPISEAKFVSTKMNMKENLLYHKGSNTDFISKIPVYGGKTSKVSSSQGKNQCLTAGTPLKFSTEKIYKNQKFNHVISPVNAYIHSKPSNKPTVVSVKPEASEIGITKLFKLTKIDSLKKNKPFQELAYPFIQGQNATPHHIAKRLESKLLRFGSAQKVIASNTSKLLKQNDSSRKK